MKTLVVMRHGKAQAPALDQADEDRSLTKAGMQALDARLSHMLGLLETNGSTVQIWASPAKRACQTAELVKKALKRRGIPHEKKIEAHESLWEQDLDAFLEELRTSPADFVFAVGHIPFAEDIVDELAGSTPSFSTGALACLEVHFAPEDAAEDARDSARLLWFAQGPVAANWATLTKLQDAMTQVAEVVEDRRAAFFADPADIETIHRFRTNIRTLRSLVAFIKPWQNAAQNTETQELLKEIVGCTSHLRELDVFEKQANAKPDASPELLAFCKKEASKERAKVLKALSSKRLTKAFDRAMALAKDVRWKKDITETGLPATEVRTRFDALVASVQADLDSLRLADVERTHDVRKRAKRARYVAEFNEGILGVDAVDIAKGMMAHQDNLGDVCDARVNIAMIAEFLQRDLPLAAIWDLTLMRAQNETFLYQALKADEVE